MIINIKTMYTQNKRIICVDLDGTFIQTDMLYESFVYSFLRKPLIIFLCAFWIVFGGKTLLKKKLAQHFSFDPSILPINRSVFNLIKQKKCIGYKIYLVSASTDSIVRSIYKYYSDIFDGYYSTDSIFANLENINLEGEVKAKFIQKEFCNCEVEYIGNSNADIEIWKICKKAYAVSATKKFSSDLDIEYLKPNKNSTLVKLMYSQLRVYQWIKNILVFIPVIATHQLLSSQIYLNCLLGFLAFSLVASVVYVINDLFDLENDRSHYKKKYRPLASADLSLLNGIVIAFFCLVCGSVLAYSISSIFLILIIIYIIINFAYSFKIKKIAALDCILLSILYSYRIFLGIIIANLTVSVWLISFSFFIFLALAYIKRYSELYSLKNFKIVKTKGRGYQVKDMPVVIGMSIASGFLSVLVLDIYFSSEEIRQTFKTIWLSYFCIPLLLYWLSRVFIKTVRGNMSEDPIKFALKDKISLFTGCLFVLFFLFGATIEL